MDPDRDPLTERGEGDDKTQPPVRQSEIYTLNVTHLDSQGKREPVAKELRPWYLPQVMGHLLPRLVPLGEVKTYLFDTYVGDQRQVMLRYVDVGQERVVDLAGRRVRAVPISDRLGIEGTPTVHYVGADGQYLGSQTTYLEANGKKSTVLVLPSDKETLLRLWTNAKLTRPDPVEMPNAPKTAK